MNRQTNKLKKNFSLKNLFFILISIALGLSCKKEGSLSNDQNFTQKDGIKIKDGRLSFSKKAFDDLMQQSHKLKSINMITNTIDRLNHGTDFISLRKEAQNVQQTGKLSSSSLKNSPNLSIEGSIIPQGSNEYLPIRPIEVDLIKLDSLVTDPYFASVLSPEGEIEVDNTLYRITELGTFLVASEDEAQLDTLLINLNNGFDLASNIINQEHDLFSLLNNDNIFFIDSYGQMNGLIKTDFNIIPNTNPTNTIMDFPLEENVFTNVDEYDFNDAKTWAGKGFQELFGRAHFKGYNNTNKSRLKVNFYSTNWGVFASVGARAVIQTRGWTGLYRPLQNFDEMRLGWNNVVIQLELPPLNPIATQPGDFWDGVTRALKSNINFNFKGIDKNFLVYRIDQILAFDQITHTLPFDLKTKLNTLIIKLNKTDINTATWLESELDKQAVERLVKYVKANAQDKTKEVAFTNHITSSTANTIGQIIIPQSWEYRFNSDGNAVMSQTFDFQTAIVGIKNGSFIFKPAKSLNLISGAVTALGKLNGEWVGMSVVKK